MKDLMEKELRAIKILYNYMYGKVDNERIKNDYKHDYLTFNKGRNGKLYAWYSDETRDTLCEIETLEIIDNDKEFIEKQFL